MLGACTEGFPGTGASAPAGEVDTEPKVGFFDRFKRKTSPEAPAQSQSVKLIERDIEAPDVFQKAEAGLWDGRPSLGGVWVAHPDVAEPERVIIRNQANGKFVIGALFRRERENPGPRFQVSSDAASALSMLAGQPIELNVTALRREEVAEEPAQAAPTPVAAPASIEATPLDPIQSASAAIDKAEAATSTAATPTPAAPKPAAAPASVSSSSPLAKPFLQIGIFSVEANANKAAKQMNSAGMTTVVKEQSLKGKTYWRVLVGPAQTSSDRSALLSKIKTNGFTDAYAVKN
ncbi:MAG: SPOR domain-containing protein [Thalassovita sp.]